MLKLLLLSVLQSFCLAGGQLCLKQALVKAGTFSWSINFFVAQLTNWWFLFTGITLGSATVLWMYILKHYPLSSAYPLTCLSYVFGMILGMIFLHETIPYTRWIGVLFILIGAFFIIK
ncbi:MAG: EamA family transporter [Paludibacteraceae bacterium]|nr:EamA family transporter [Paludibacteraceae bacterium]MBR5971635.1 EamA family transporter [Paludibacteraceae bacterium]